MHAAIPGSAEISQSTDTPGGAGPQGIPAAPGGAAPRVRKDVARNRAHLLATANKLIAERGLDITFHDLAAAAGTGVGTVYRHFADRDELLGALITDRFTMVRDIMLSAEQIDDPIQALREAVTRTCEIHQADRATLQAMLSGTEEFRRIANQELLPISERIVARAQATGRVRPDFTVTDLPMIFSLSGAFAPGSRPDLWRRYVNAFLDGFMTSDEDRVGPGTDPPTEAEIDEIISRRTAG